MNSVKTVNCLFFLYLTLFAFIYCEKKTMFEKDDIQVNNLSKTKMISKRKLKGTELKPKEGSALRVTKEQLGRFTWTLLHSIAASFPVHPNDEDKEMVSNFLNSLAYLFPCKKCSKHFTKMLEEHPVQSGSRKELVYYLCGLHNKVNKRLGKKQFNCEKAFEFWGGDCGCSASKK